VTRMFVLVRPAKPLATLALLAMALAGCGSGADDGAGPDGGAGPATSPNGLALVDGGQAPSPTAGSFIAFQPDFQAYPTWTHFELASEAAVGSGDIHRAGKRVVYINTLPAPGARAFDTGTIIVKAMADGEVFARVKRGGDYNKNGPVGWEWFELKQAAGEWQIVWRGITPPAGYCYGGIAGGACNDCHRAFAANDYVATAALDLAKQQ
jgi:hypothetical protein